MRQPDYGTEKWSRSFHRMRSLTASSNCPLTSFHLRDHRIRGIGSDSVSAKYVRARKRWARFKRPYLRRRSSSSLPKETLGDCLRKQTKSMKSRLLPRWPMAMSFMSAISSG